MTLNYEPPSGWTLPRFDEIAASEAGAIRIGPFGSALKKHEYSRTGIRVLGIEDVYPNRLVSTNPKYIPEAKYRELAQYTVKPSDLLITNMGTVGRTCVVPADLETSIISSHLIKVTLDRSMADPSYVAWMLNSSPLVVAQIRAKWHGAIMAGFNSSLLKQIRVPLPPLDEQKRLAGILDHAAALRLLHEKSIAQVEELIAALQARIYQGHA